MMRIFVVQSRPSQARQVKPVENEVITCVLLHKKGRVKRELLSERDFLPLSDLILL